MSWFNIVKQPKLRTSPKITTQLGSKTEENDDSCKKRLLAFLEATNLPSFYNQLDDVSEEFVCEFIRKQCTKKSLISPYGPYRELFRKMLCGE